MLNYYNVVLYLTEVLQRCLKLLYAENLEELKKKGKQRSDPFYKLSGGNAMDRARTSDYLYHYACTLILCADDLGA